MDTIKWGIIGVGDVCEVKSGPALQKTEHSELVAVMRRNGDLARDFAERHSVPRWYDDADALINDPDINAIYIATPPYAHLDYTRRVAAAGKPVYVEKPMANNHAECQDMITACEAANVPLYVAYYRRALPYFLKIKELIDAGTLGEIRLVTVNLQEPRRVVDPDNVPWRYVPALSGGGIFLDLGSHMLDLLDFFLGPIRSVQGVASNQLGDYAAEDIVAGNFIFASGVHGVGSWCFTGHQKVDRTEIVGSKGTLIYSTFGTDPLYSGDAANAPFYLTVEGNTTSLAFDHPPHIQQPLIQTMVDDLRGVGTCDSTGLTGARTSWVMDEMLAEYRALPRE